MLTEQEKQLFEAVGKGNVNKVKELIENGANVNALYSDGDSPLHKAAGYSDVDSPFRKVAEKTLDLTKSLLYSKEINVNHQGRNRDTPLHRAVKDLRQDTVKALLKVKGIKLDFKDDQSKTPLHTAIEKWYDKKMTKWLIDAGANVNRQDNNGKTPMHMAVEKWQDAEMVKWLIDAGVDVNIKDNTGKTSLDIAVEKKCEVKMMELLIKHTLPQNHNIKPSGLQEEDLAYWNRCEREIIDMKGYKLSDGVSLLDILTTNDKRKLASHMSNENIVETFRSNVNAIKEEFPIYSGQIGKQCKKGLDELERICAVEKVVDSCLVGKQTRDPNIKEFGLPDLNEYALREILKYADQNTLENGKNLLRDLVPNSNLRTTSVEVVGQQRGNNL